MNNSSPKDLLSLGWSIRIRKGMNECGCKHSNKTLLAMCRNGCWEFPWNLSNVMVVLKPWSKRVHMCWAFPCHPNSLMSYDFCVEFWSPLDGQVQTWWLHFNVHVFQFANYLTLRSVSSLTNPQNSEMKFCENMELTCWIVLIIIGYILNNFTTHITIL
jgi:hypothetical protein